MIAKKFIFYTSVAMCLLACSKEETAPNAGGVPDRKPLAFSAEMSQASSSNIVRIDSMDVKGGVASYLVRTFGESIGYFRTKAAPVTDLSSYGAFCLYGYQYGQWNDTVKPEFMISEKVSLKNGKWITGNTFSTNAAGRKVRFYGYAPFGADGISVPSNTSGPLGFSYTVPSAVSEQKDLLVGASGEYGGELSDLSMSFDHCLSAVTFKTGPQRVDGTIKSITLKGVYSKGNYVCGSGWSGHGARGDFRFAQDVSVSEDTEGDITCGPTTMMLIPQIVPSDASIEVVIESEGKTNTLTAPLSGDVWAEGKQCVYALNFESIAGMKISLDVSSLTLEWGESRDITVTADPADQNWAKEITGTGLSAEKINSSTIRVSNGNISGTDDSGLLTVTTQDRKRHAEVLVMAKSLQEGISLSPAEKTIAYGQTAVFTASGTYPQGFTLNTPEGALVTRDGNSISVKNTTGSYTAKDITLSATTSLMNRKASSAIHLAARPETISLDRKTLSIDSHGTGTIKVSGDYDSFTATLSDDEYADVKVSGNAIEVTNRNVTFDTKTVTLTAKTTGDTGASATADITLKPFEDYVTAYKISPISLDKTDVPASGGTITVSGGKVTQEWASGKKVEGFADAVISVERAAGNTLYPATVNKNIITVNSLGVNIVSDGIYTVTASYSKDNVSAEPKTAQFTQAENKVTDSNYNPDKSSYTASVSIGGGLTASGGSATVTFSASHSALNRYSSGASDNSYHKVYDPATVAITTNGNNAFSLAGSVTQTGDGSTCTLNHVNMGTAVRTDNVTVTAINDSMPSGASSDSESVSNTLLEQHYKDRSGTPGEIVEGSSTLKSRGTPTVSIGDGLTAAGGSATVTASVKDVYTGTTTTTWYQRYSSGSWSDLYSINNDGDYEQSGEVTLSIASNGNNRFSLSGNTLSHGNMTTNETTDKVTVKAVNKNSTEKSATASKSITNSRHAGTKSTKNHTRTGSVSYGNKSYYGNTSWGSKSYGSEYLKDTSYDPEVKDADTYGSWSTYNTSVDKYDYAVAFAVTSWSPGAEATSKSNSVTASHYERDKYEQRRTITHHYHTSYTDHYYKDWTRTGSRNYSRTASQNCNYVECRTDSFDSGSTQYVEENKSHTESWTDYGTDNNYDTDSGSDWTRDAGGSTSRTSDGGYDYQTTYGTGSKVTDSPAPSSSESWLTYSGGTMSVTANGSTSSRSATLSVKNGTAGASCSVTQEGKPADQYDIDVD